MEKWFIIYLNQNPSLKIELNEEGTNPMTPTTKQIEEAVEKVDTFNEYNIPTLLEVQGMIATCAIENREHEEAYKRCGKLIEKYGALTRIKNWKELCYPNSIVEG